MCVCVCVGGKKWWGRGEGEAYIRNKQSHKLANKPISRSRQAVAARNSDGEKRERGKRKDERNR